MMSEAANTTQSSANRGTSAVTPVELAEVVGRTGKLVLVDVCDTVELV